VDVHERRAYEEQIELFRRMIRRTPRWHVAERDGHPVVVDGQDAVVFRIEDSGRRTWSTSSRACGSIRC
jgi:hypothetical protein